MMKSFLLLTLSVGCIFFVLPTTHVAGANAEDSTPKDFFEMSLEELLQVSVYSISKRQELLKDSAAAVYVLTREDIRRSGLTSFAEMMRLVPGMHVAQKNASVWGIASRGFNSARTNKLLVLIDGRSVYSGLYAGVYWDQLDYILDDIERIEVIRGPGGAIWGANAVNGVVNIITRSTKDTHGGYTSFRSGVNENYIAEARYGGKILEDTSYRLYVKSAQYDGFVFANDANVNNSGDAFGKVAGDDSFDDWDMTSGGFSFEQNLSGRDVLQISGDLYDGAVNDAHDLDEETVDGYNLNLRYTHSFTGDSHLHVQSYYNHFYRLDGFESDPTAILRDLDLFDLDLVYERLFHDHRMTAGAGYRNSRDDTNGQSYIAFDPASRSDDLYSLFIQDEIALFDQSLKLTIGSKFEHNIDTGWEIQPTFRLLKEIDFYNIVWGAVTRSTRTPSRLESDSLTRGAVDVDAENAISYEIGYRLFAKRLSFDTTLFYVNYDKLLAVNDDGSSSGNYDNIIEGRSYGFEVSATWRILDNWKLLSSYSYQEIDLEVRPGFVDQFNAVGRDESNPKHQFNVRSYWDITDHLELDLFYYYVDDLLSGVGESRGAGVDAYSRVDVRLSWHLNGLELSAGVQNIFDDAHNEFSSTSVSAAAVERNIYGQAKWRF